MSGVRTSLPLPAWAALIGALAAVVAAGVTVALRPDAAVPALAGAAASLLVSGIGVWAARRVAASLCDLHAEAVDRLDDPAAPLSPGERRFLSTELDDLARALDGLHHRVRLADELGERHRREAQTTGAGVFELLSGLVTAEEGARGQLAAELHDTVAQSLMIARSMLAGRPSTPQDIAKVTDYVEDAEEQVRAVMARTRPPALREGDLASAVNGLRADVLARYGLAVEIDWPPAAYPLPLAAAITVYRFFQEALLNVVKHADVDDARLRLVVEQTAVVATVSDDGPGFDPGAVRPDRGRHVGLGLLRERARLSGGSLEVLSAVGAGATLTLRLPRSSQVAPPELREQRPPAALPDQRAALPH